MKKTILTIILALVTLTGWAQKQNNFTISGDFSTLNRKMSVPVKAVSVYILNDSTMIIPEGKKQEKDYPLFLKTELLGYFLM